MGKCYCKVEHKWCKFCSKGITCRYNNEFTCNIRKCPRRIENETISFRELLFTVSFSDIMEAMYKYWPQEKKNEAGYKKLYTTLLTIRGKKSNYFIDCSIEGITAYNNDGSKKEELDYYIDACCKLPYKKMKYAMDFTPWNEVVTMNITKECLSSLSAAEIAAGVFYEITFYGFNEIKVQNTYQDLVDRFENSIKMQNNEKTA